MSHVSIEDLKKFLAHNNKPGWFIRRMCECGDGSCRIYKCNKCTRKELRILERDTKFFGKKADALKLGVKDE